jgi:thiosulfate dehydrogenase
MKRAFLAGAVAGVGVLTSVVFGYFWFGMAPVATAAPPMPFEKMLAKAALRARLQREMPTIVPIKADEPTLVAGAELYRENCAVCHGLPKRPATNIARGMFPDPPQLFVKTVTDDPEGKIYWKTKGGIRMTGMPAFEKSLSDNQLWQVSLLLKHADAVPLAVQKVLEAP